MREIRKISLKLTSGNKELVDEIKKIVHVALVDKYSPSSVRARKTVPKKTYWNREYYEAKITVDISIN